MNQEMLDRFFRGECSSDELGQVLTWYSSTEADPVLEAEINKCFEDKYSDTPESFSWNKGKVLNKILKQTEKKGVYQSHVSSQGVEYHSSRLHDFFSSVFKIAAVLVMALGAAWWFAYSDMRDAVPEQQVVVSHKSLDVHKAAKKGQKITLTLSDGTRIKLNAESKITYREDFNAQTERVVKLEGEAFFDVAHDASRPFVILAGNTETRVLGTSFNVSAYPEDATISVAVLSGKVRVDNIEKNISNPLFLVPGEKSVHYKNGGNNIEKTIFEYEAEMGWRDGILRFENAGFQEIAKKLERWYGKKIIVKRGGIPQDFTGIYYNKSLKDVLEGMSYVLGFDYEIEEDTIRIL